MSGTESNGSKTVSHVPTEAVVRDARSGEALSQLEPGRRLAERYCIVRRLGQGAMGTVFEAIDEQRSGLQVALKLLNTRQPNALYRLKNEFRALAETVHPNLVGLHGLGVDALGWFVVMDLIDPGSDFLSYVRDTRGRSYHEGRLRAALIQLVRGIAAIHAAGKLHRDLKPRNVVVAGDGRVVIVDFGLVGDLEQGGAGITQEGGFAGTPGYAAPEQMLGEGLGPPADLYAVGVMLYEALTGRLPTEGGPAGEPLVRKKGADLLAPSALVPGIPADLERLCAALLQVEPSRRPDAAQVLQQLGEHAPLQPEAVSTQPFVARERELDLLGAAATLRSAAPRVVVVSGPSGIGKTALLARFLERSARTAGAACMRGRCHPHEQLPFKAFDTLIDELGRLLMRAPPLEAASLMPRDIPLLSRLFPTLSRVPAVSLMPAGPDAELDQALLRSRAFAALKELLARIADRRSLILAIDDLQWSDHDSAALLCELLRQPGAPACLFICVFREARPGEHPLAETLRALTGSIDLRLEPLDAQSSVNLARALLGAERAEAELQLVVHEAVGSPLLLKELSRHARTSGQVQELRETVTARILQLDADARRLLWLVCVAGQPLELDIALRAAQAEPRALPAVLASSLLRFSFRHGRECLESQHERLREAVLAGLAPQQHAQLHGELARAFAQAATPDPALVARHYHAAGEPLLALGYVVTAAKQARHALALGRAAELYALALEHASAADKPQLELELADALASVGRLGDAAEIYERALAGAASAEQQRDLVGKAMVLHLLLGNLERGARLLDGLCKQLGLRPPPRSPWLAKLALALLYLRFKLGPRMASLQLPKESRHTAISSQRLELCLRAARGLVFWSFEHGAYFGWQALLIIRSRRDPRHWPFAIACEVSARSALRGISSERDEREMAAALALAEGQGDPDVYALVLGGAGARCLFVGQFVRAIELFERAEQVLARRGRSVAPLFNWVRSGLYTAWTTSGRVDQLLTRADAWVTEARALGDRRGTLIAQLMESYRLVVLDQPLAMSEVVSILLAADREGLSLHPCWLVEPALYLDQAEEALAMHQAASPGRAFVLPTSWALDRIGHSHLWIRTYLAAALRNPRRRAAYLQMVQREVRRLRRERLLAGPAVLAQARAGLAIQHGQTDRALRELEVAAVHFGRSGHQLYAAAARERIGLLLKGDRGAQLVADARAAAVAVGVRNPERMFRAMVTGFPE